MIVSPSPHRKSAASTQKIMLSVIIALMPQMVASGIIFGPRAILVVVTCVASCIFFEYFSRILMKKSNTISDLSAVVTGIILAFNLSATIPLYMAIIGSFIAIVIVKQLFGGLGQNFANPAIVGRIALMMSFPTAMTHWVKPFYYISGDVTTSATPLNTGIEVLPSYKDLFFGTTGGCLGETCAFALLLGGIFLAVKGIISLSAPVAFIGTVAALTFIFGGDPLYQILSGSVFLGAFFMATDYATTPLCNSGKVIFGIGCGVITVIIRMFGSYPEGVSFGILIMNILTPYIDILTKTRPLGAKKEAKNDQN